MRQDAYATLAASLDAYLSDPGRAAAVLPALGRVWPELLQSIAMGLRQASTTRPAAQTPSSAGSGTFVAAGGTTGGGAGASYRAVTAAELTSMVHVLELACLLALQARQASLAAGLLPLLLAQLPAAPPELACACLDACLAIQLRHPPGFVSFAEQQGVQQVCLLLKDRATSEPVRSHAVQFLNLLLTQVGVPCGAGRGQLARALGGLWVDRHAVSAPSLLPDSRNIPCSQQSESAVSAGRSGLRQLAVCDHCNPLSHRCPAVGARAAAAGCAAASQPGARHPWRHAGRYAGRQPAAGTHRGPAGAAGGGGGGAGGRQRGGGCHAGAGGASHAAAAGQPVGRYGGAEAGPAVQRAHPLH